MLTLMTLSLVAAPQTVVSVQQAPTAAAWQVAQPVPLFSESAAPSLPFDPTLFGRGVASADLDRDGSPDFVISTSSGAVLYMNRGPAGLVDETVMRLPAGLQGSDGPVVGDVDGDGWADLLLLADSSPGVDVVLFSNGFGGFLPPIPLPMASAVTSDAELVDIDLDGDLDLVRAIGSSGHANTSGKDTLLLNDGLGGFTPLLSFESAAWNSSLIPSTGVTSFDANRDGVLDLFFTRADSGSATGSPGARNLLLLGRGAGQYIDASVGLPSFEDNSYDAVPLDLDGDGDLDLVVANSLLGLGGASSGDVLVNQGGLQGGRAGAFQDRFDSIEETPTIAEAIRLGPLCADVDGDGRKDVLFRVHDLPPGGEQPLFLGRGLDFERATPFGAGSFIAAGGAFADIDGDGDPDLLLTSAGSAAGGSQLGHARLFLNVSP